MESESGWTRGKIDYKMKGVLEEAIHKRGKEEIVIQILESENKRKIHAY